MTAAAIKVKINWNELRAYYSSGINEVFKGAFQLPLHEKDFLVDVILVAAVLLCNTEPTVMVASNANSHHDQIRMKLKNELRNAVGCCLRLETTNAAQLLDSTEPKNDTASPHIEESVPSTASAAPPPSSSTSSSSSSSSSSLTSCLPTDSKELSSIVPGGSSVPLMPKMSSLLSNADRRAVLAEVNFLQFHKSQDILVPFDEICRRSSDFIARLKSSTTVVEENTVLRNLLTSIESDLSNTDHVSQKMYIDEVEHCVSSHAVFLIDMVSAFVSSFKDGRALENLRKRNIDGGLRHGSDKSGSAAGISADSATLTHSTEAAPPDTNQSASAISIKLASSLTPTPPVNHSTISNETINSKLAVGSTSADSYDFGVNEWENSCVGNNDHAEHVASYPESHADHFISKPADDVPIPSSNITDASAKKSRSRSNLQGFQIEQKKSSEETPFLNRLHAEVTASMSQSSRTSIEFAKNANMDSTVSAPKPAIPALLSPASLNRQTRQKSKTNTNESAVSIVPAQDATSDISRSTRNSRPLQIHSAMPTNVQATTRTAQTSRRAEEIKISGTKSRRHDEVIRTARTRIRPRKSNISNIYGCERRSRRGIVAIMEEEDDSIDPDIGFCLLSSGLQSSPDSDVARANSEEPLCLPLWIQSSLEKGSWCKPGKVVGLYMDGVGPPSISSVVLGVVVDNYVSDLSEDRDRRSTLLICLRGEVPVILDSPIEEAAFFNAQRDDVVCIDNLGSVRLLSSINLGNCSEAPITAATSYTSDGMMFINDNSEGSSSSYDSSNISTPSPCCRPIGTAFRHGTQFNELCEPVALAIQSVVVGENISSSVTVKFQKWLENESALQDSDDWQTVKVTSQNFLGEEGSNSDNEWLNIAVIKGIRVVLLEHLNLFYLYQNYRLVGEQIQAYTQILEHQKELYQKQCERITQQQELMQQLNGLMEKMESTTDIDEYSND